MTNIEILIAKSGKARLKIPVSIYQGVKKPEVFRTITLGNLFDEIQNKNLYSATTSAKLREHYKNDKTAYSRLKENLFGFSVGKFSRRADKAIEVYVPLLVFDIDGLPDEKAMSMLVQKSRKCPYIFAVFPSISGHGLRVMIWTESTPNNHKEYYNAVTKLLENFYKIKTDKTLRAALKLNTDEPEKQPTALQDIPRIDTSTSNVSRFWFYDYVSNDDFYLNSESIPYKLKKSDIDASCKTDNNPGSVISLAEKITLCKKVLSNKKIATGRNNMVFSFAKILHEHGIPKATILSECLAFVEPDFDKIEITRTVSSALKNTVFQKYSDQQLVNYLDIANEKETAKETYENDNDAEKEESRQKRKTKFQRIKKHLMNKYDFRLNEISMELEFKIKHEKNYSILNENNLIVEFLEIGFQSVESSLMPLLKSDFVPKYNPFVVYFNNLTKWDESQPDYITQLAGFVDAKDQEWFNFQFKKMLVRAVACALNIIPFNKHCFTLIGKQNDGKTSFLRFLCPTPLRDYIKENLDIHNKDGRVALCQNLFVNLDELANFSKYDINRVKAFFTIDKVKERLPYERRASNHLRRASFLASTNSDEFLTDETGNVRWLVFEINSIKHDNGGSNGYNQQVDIDKVYSQAFALLQSDFVFKMTSEEISKSEENNKGYKVTTVEQELIQSLFGLPAPNEKDAIDVVFMTSTDILRKLEVKTSTRLSIKNIGKAMKSLGFVQVHKRLKITNESGLSHSQPRRGFWVRCIES